MHCTILALAGCRDGRAAASGRPFSLLHPIYPPTPTTHCQLLKLNVGHLVPGCKGDGNKRVGGMHS